MPTNKKSKNCRATPMHRPELDERRAALSAESRLPGWKRLAAAERFHRSYAVVAGTLPGSECHHWIGVKTSEGYGQFTVKGHTFRAHRYALEEIYGRGPIDKRCRVYRRCGDTACVNPDHLWFDATPFEWDDPLTAPQLDGVTIPRPAAARFRAKVDKDRDGNCWWWTGTVGAQGYGPITLAQGWITNTHRMAYALAHGFIPDGLHVCHGPECEEPTGAGRLCVNPDHLIADTHTANMADKDGGHFRRPLSKIPVSPETRWFMGEFLPHAIAASPEQGNLDGKGSLEGAMALNAPINYSEPGTPNVSASPLQPA